MKGSLQVVAGTGTCPPGAIHRLALAAADMARARGLIFEKLKVSHVQGSCSQYLCIRDRSGRPWLIRISNHYRPRRAQHCETPNFNLVSIDGVSGRGSLEFFLDEVAAGRVEWFDPAESYRPKPRKRRRA